MRLENRIPAVWLVISGIISVQFGAAIAKDLFQLIPPTAMVWLRLITLGRHLVDHGASAAERAGPSGLARSFSASA